ncbi:MAG TPA: hypothetical protein VFV87_07405 [Pirellulaceae bacterium]|nr:hypothetical protein [Pirellulaceae bacterium]
MGLAIALWQMLISKRLAILGAGGLWLTFAAAASAAPPWATLIPFKRIEADAEKSYELDESHGPWLIIAASFAGPTAQQQAHDLVIELRQRYKLEAYTFEKVYDFTNTTEGLGVDEFGSPKRMKYMHAAKFQEIAVMVGNFASIEDPELEKTLDKIKYAKPDVLQRDVNNKTQRMAVVRALYRFVDSNPATRSKGPMGSAFVTRNPLLPEEYFAAKGLDPFLVDLNRDLPNSLLECPGRYTVRVASFRGVDTMKPAEFERLTSKPRDMAKIDQAAQKAYDLCAALRQQGYEAYQFHDRTESIVTVGSFDSVGTPRQDGKTEINPAVHEIMKRLGPSSARLPGQAAMGLAPKVVAGIALDPQPLPVEVPRESIAAAYNQTKTMLR